MACDICGKTGTSLTDLLDIYQTDDIKQMCPDCAKVVNKHLGKIQSSAGKIQRSLLKSFMKVLKGNKWAPIKHT